MIRGYPAAHEDNDKYCDSNDYWRIVFAIPIVPCIIRSIMLTLVFNEDPPGYYVALGDEDKATSILRKIYKSGHVEE